MLPLLRIGTTEIILIAAVILLLFGARRIPELMRSLGSGTREFKKGMRGEGDEAKAEDAAAKTEAPPPETEKDKDKPSGPAA
ncbi:MAG: twin-arginine translocase TatA/TatE family subunit [bacterium]